MRKQQRGITLIGWLILLAPVAICGYAGIRLTPVYLNYMNVVHSLEQVSGEVDGGTATAATIRTAVEKHFNVEYIEYPDVKDLKIVRDGRTWTIEANYDDQAPLFANVALLVTFDKRVTVKGSVGE
jgi:Domain of unknown function (DUF4845)